MSVGILHADARGIASDSGEGVGNIFAARSSRVKEEGGQERGGVS